MSSGSVSQPKTNGSGKIIPADLEALPQLEAGTAKDIEPAQKDAPPPRVPYRALFRYADKWDILAMIAGTLGSLVNGASMPIFAIILGDIMNDFGLYQDDFSGLTSKIRDTVPYFVYLGLVAFVGAYCQGFFWTTASVRQVNRMRGVYLHRVLHQEIGYFDTVATSGFLLQGLNEDCITIQTAIGDKVAMFLFFSSTFVCGTVIALVRGWDMALVIMSLLPVLGGAGFAVMLLVARMTSIINRAYAGANSLAQQALSNVRTVYAFNGEERTVTDYGNSLDEPMKVGIKQGFIAGSTLGLVNCVAFCTYALAMWYGAKRVEDGVYDGGKVLTVLFASLIGGFALGQAAPNIQYFQQGQVSGARLFEILDRKSEIDADGPGKTLKSVEGVVELRDVTFAYPARPDKPVFDGFNLIVPAGQTVALVGESGSGKSTVVQLIERFFDPQAGTVFLDNVDIRTLQLRWLRSQIGLVSQEPTLFATTIRENILFGKPGSTQEEVIQAAKASNAHEFISALPEGYDTHVGEKGVQMSGGQKQRIAIARAILKDPRVLLLDEATSALDAESEHVVQEALDKLMVGRTTVVVAHRLSTVRDANSIAVVYQGRIIEQGTHDGLLKQNGAYATLVQMQQSSDPSSSSPKGSSRRQKTISSTQDTEHHSSDLKEFADHALEVVVESLQSPNKNRNMAVPLMAPQRMTSGWRRYFSSRARNREPQEAIPEQEPYDPKKKPEKASKSKKKSKEEDEGPPVKVGLGRLAKLNKPELPAAAGGLLGSAAMGMLFPIFALAFSSLIAVFYLPPDEISSGAQKWSLVFMGLGFGSLVASWMQSYCFNFMGQRLGRRVRVLMMQALLRQEVGWFDDERNSSGVLTSKLSADALAVKGQFGDTMGLLTQNLVTMVASFIIAGVNSWRMMLVVTSCLPILVISVVIQNLFMLRSGTEEEETFAQANATAAEAFSSARTVAAFGMEDQVAALYRRSLEKPTTEARKRANYAGIGFGSSQLVVFGVYALAFWYMGLEITRGYSSFEDTLIAFMAIFMAAMGIAQAQVYFPDVAKGKAAVQRVFSIIDRKPLIDASDPGGFRPSACEGKVELRDVTFAYPQRPDAPVFTNFNLIAPAGSTVAIVGESGSGKSTVVQLIERFYDPLEGTILLDDVDIRTLNLHWLRSQVGLVSQEPVLFSMTVAENIRYGRPEASLESVIAAAKAANAHTFIEALPEGYNTLLGEGAIQLSGGQKQRVAIARAVVKDPRVLLLDEATSALDAESERVVQEALDKLMVGRTTIVIAHRLSTIKDADSIAVVYKGHLVEQGTHRDLVAADGTYARLVSHQL